MKSTHKPHFQLFIAALLVLSFTLSSLVFVPVVDADEPELVTVKMYLDNENTEHMNTGASNPANEDASDGAEWEYGWWETDHLEDTQFLSDVYVKGTLEDGEKIVVRVNIAFRAAFGNTDVTMQLLDNGVPIAEDIVTLSGNLEAGPNSNNLWELEFLPEADADDHHVFEQGHGMRVEVFPEDGDSINIDYMGGDARLEFYGNPIASEEFYLNDYWGNEKKGDEFVASYPESASEGYGVIHFRGSFLNTFSYRDTDVNERGGVDLLITAPDAREIEVNDIPVEPDGDGLVWFYHNWTYGDEMEDEDDAGTYYVDIIITENHLEEDDPGNQFVYDDELYFDISPYGVYLEFEEEVKEQTKHAGPGESVEYNLRVWNAGLTDDDTYEITHTVVPDDWEVFADPDTIVLDAQQSDVFVFNVTIPEDADVDDKVGIDLTAKSQLSVADETYDEAIDDVETTTKVTAIADVKVFFGEQDSDADGSEWEDEDNKQGNAEKGAEKDFNFRVKNDSPGEDTIDLYRSRPPSDWTAVIIDPDSEEEIDNVTLEGLEEVLLLIRVKPATAQGGTNTYDLEISGTSRNDETVQDSAMLRITRTLGVVVYTDDGDKLDELTPGVPNPIDIIIENTGNDDRTFDFIIDDSKVVPERWTISSPKDKVDIESGKSEVVTIQITPDYEATRRDGGYEITITAEDEGDASVKYEYVINMNVKTVYRLEMEITQREKEMDDAGDSVEYIIIVTNSGNSKVTINLEIEDISKDSWNARLSKSADEFEPGDEKQFILTVTAPDPVDNKESCTVTVSAVVLNQPDTLETKTTKTTVTKGGVDTLVDTLKEYSWVFLLVLVVVIIAIVLYYHSQEYEEEDEYDEDYYDEEDDWE